MSDYASYVERVAAIVARFTLKGPLPTFFEVKPEELEAGVIVRAKMARIDSRTAGCALADASYIWTTAREMFALGLSDEQIEAALYDFARCTYDHEFHEWFRRDGKIYRDPHEGEVPHG